MKSKNNDETDDLTPQIDYIYSQGQEDKRNGFSNISNPYNLGSLPAQIWLNGYLGNPKLFLLEAHF